MNNGTDSRRRRAILDAYASESGVHLIVGGILDPSLDAPRAFNTKPVEERIRLAAEALAPRGRAADSRPAPSPSPGPSQQPSSLHPDDDQQKDFFTDDPSGQPADYYSDGTRVTPQTEQTRRRYGTDALRRVHGKRVYTDAERSKLHTWLDKVIDRRLGRKAQGTRAADTWSEDLNRDAAATEKFGTDMLADDDLAARYIANSQARWPSQCNFTSGQPKAFTSAQAEKLQPRWTAKARDTRNDNRSDAQRFEDDAAAYQE